MPREQPPTAKGARRAEAILDATLRSVAVHGYSATSVDRVAREAGVNKRSVLYYFGTRTHLIDLVVRRIGDRLMQQAREATAGIDDPKDALAAGLQRVWDGLTADPVLVAAYVGVVSEAGTDERLRVSATHVVDGFEGLILEFLDRHPEVRERLLVPERAGMIVLIAGVRGLLLQFAERGDSPELRQALGLLQHSVMTSLAPAGGGRAATGASAGPEDEPGRVG